MLQRNFKIIPKLLQKEKLTLFFHHIQKKNLILTIASLKEKPMNLSIDKASDELNLKIKKLTKKLKQ